MDVNQITRTNLHNTVAAELRAMIADGRLLPGTRISERQICEKFGISRTPLREAFKVLATEGLIETEPSRGARVARLTRADVQHVFELMQALEALGGELACQRIPDAEVAELRAKHYQMRAHFERQELGPYYQLNRQIHEGIIAAARNPLLETTYHHLSARIRCIRFATEMPHTDWMEAMRDHEMIIDCLVRRDGERLASVLRRHLKHKCDQAVRNGFAIQEPAKSVSAPLSDGISSGAR